MQSSRSKKRPASEIEIKSELKDSDSIKKFKKFSTNNNKAALLIHGGCFTQGNETWNKEQAQAIATNCNLDVFTLDFSKISFDASIKDIKNFFQQLYEKYKGQVGLIGCSSGGFLALNVLKEINTPLFVILICPVMDPSKREKMLLEIAQNTHNKNIQIKQLSYFKSKPYPTTDFTRSTLNIIAAKNDENVPLSLILSEMKRYPHAILHIVEGAHSISYKSSSVVIEIINKVAIQEREGVEYKAV